MSLTVAKTTSKRRASKPACESERQSEPRPESEPGSRLPGGTVLWVFIGVELATFGAFFVAFAASAGSIDDLGASRGLLHPAMGAINTGVLLIGSWLAARGVLCHGTPADRRHTGLWFLACGLSGIVFLAIKSTEYADIFSEGVSLSTNTFWFYYLFLTVMHYLHVVFGVGVMLVLGMRIQRGGSVSELGIEAAAGYWHLVDLIWIVLFPVLYLMEVS